MHRHPLGAGILTHKTLLFFNAYFDKCPARGGDIWVLAICKIDIYKYCFHMHVGSRPRSAGTSAAPTPEARAWARGPVLEGCSIDQHHGRMTHELEAGPPEINEEQLAASQPRVRALQIQRYERLYGRVDERVQEDERGERPLDPRFLELGIRILKEEASLYRLGRTPMVHEEEEDPTIQGVDRMDMVLRQLATLEQKRADQDDAAKARAKARADAPDPDSTLET